MKPFVTLLSISLLATAFPYAGRAQTTPADDAPAITIARKGSQPAKSGSADCFTGSVSVEILFAAKPPSHLSAGAVTFQPGARSAWHTHPVGQVLLITAGDGWIQSWGGPVQEMQAGDVVRIPPGVKHWHGASATSSVTHLALQEERQLAGESQRRTVWPRPGLFPTTSANPTNKYHE